ncbi:methionyl-tRNA formyltransferase [Thermodesulfobacteriota bacterium]
MLRIVFLGMEIRILDKLAQSSVSLVGAYLPPAPYWMSGSLPLLAKVFPRSLLKKWFRTVSAHGRLAGYLKDHQIPALKTLRVDAPGFLKDLEQLEPDLGVVANFGQILGERILNLPKYGFIGFHPSMLPLYRGPEPLGHILLNGEGRSGATWHRTVPDIDRGEILAQEEFPVEPSDTRRDLLRKSLDMAVEMLGPLLQDIERGTVKSRPQDEAMATYLPRLTREQKQQLAAMKK